MKYLYALSILLLLSNLLTSCKKSTGAVKYQLLDTNIANSPYIVSNGTIVVNTGTPVTFTAPEDQIVIHCSYSPVLKITDIIATRPSPPGTNVSTYVEILFTEKLVVNATIPGIRVTHRDKGIDYVWYLSNAKLTDYNNTANGDLITGDITMSPNLDLNPGGTSISGKVSINLKLNKQ